MTVQSDAVKIGDKELKTDWPVTEGTDAGTTKQEGKKLNLEAQEVRMVKGWGSLE